LIADRGCIITSYNQKKIRLSQTTGEPDGTIDTSGRYKHSFFNAGAIALLLRSGRRGVVV
jgi:hypothetical protein